MSTPTPTAALTAELARFTDAGDLAANISGALGLTDGGSVTGWELDPGDTVFRAWGVSGDAVTYYEQDPKGNRLTVTVPRHRIRRVAELVVDDTIVVTIELDADQTRIQLNAEHLTGPAVGPDGSPSPDQRYGRSGATATLVPSGWEIRRPAGDPAAVRLSAFAQTLRTWLR